MRDAAWVSEELRGVLADLSAQQAAGVLRIVQAEIDGRSLTSLFSGPDRICTVSTYYRRKGWSHKPLFQRALELARRDYRSWMLEHGTQDALLILADSAPHAARALRQQIVGDGQAIAVLEGVLREPDAALRIMAAQHLGDTGLPGVVLALREALAREKNAEARRALVEALGRIAALRDGDRRQAAGEILDRAGMETAPKSAVAGTLGLEALSDDELERLLDNLEAAESGGADREAAAGGGGDGPADVDDRAAADLDPGAGV